MYKPTATLTLLALLGTTIFGQQTPPPASPPGPAPAQAVPDPQMPPIVFRTEVNYVEVDAVVLDQQGSFVRDLRRDEFQIIEDGKPQSLTTFSLVDIPVTRAEQPLFSPRAIEPDVRSNVGEPDGRIYVIVLDDTHVNVVRSGRVRLAVKQFIERNLGANDLAAVVHTSGRQDASQDFTNNKRLLLEAVDKFMGKRLRSPTQEKLDEYYRTRDSRRASDPLADPAAFERAYNARGVLSTLRGIAEMLNGVSGRRKALVFVSEGIDYNIVDFMNNRDAFTIMDETRDAIGAATRANVSIYAIDPRGLTALGEDGIEMMAPPDDPSLRLDMTGLADDLRNAQNSLRVLSDETGGFAAVNANDFSSAFQRIVDENSSYYVMGYYPSNDRRDGRFRRIDVRVTRPGVTVRARKGYNASRGKAPASKGVQDRAGTSSVLTDTLNSPVQVGGLGLSVFAASFRGSAPNATVALVTQTNPLRGIPFAQKDGKYFNKLEVSVIAIDPQGKVRGGTRETIDLELKPETWQRVQRVGFRLQSRVEVPPGRYQFRVAVRETGGGAVGSVYYDLLVPDFAKAPITMSGLVMTSAMAAVVPTAGAVAELKDLLPTPATAARVFSTRDEIGLLLEVYDNQTVRAHSVEITTTMRRDDGRVVFSTSEKRSSTELGGTRGGYGCAATVPLKDMMPGLYVVKVDAKSTLAGGAASREVQVRIVP